MATMQQDKGNRGSFLKELAWFAVMLAAVVAAVWLLKTFVYQVYNIPSGSMEETIMTNDMVFAEKISFYSRDPEPGDIITFKSVDSAEQKTLIKRVIAVGGQTVELVDGKVVVDGVELDEPYVQGSSYPLVSSVVTYPYTVPEGSVWVMGDNREHSSDSRAFGAIPLENVLENAVFIYWPLSHFGTLE